MYYNLWSFLLGISYIVHELGALGVAWKVQVTGSLQVDDSFTTSFLVQ